MKFYYANIHSISSNSLVTILISISENELPPVSSKYGHTYANSHFIVAPSYVKRSLLS